MEKEKSFLNSWTKKKPIFIILPRLLLLPSSEMNLQVPQLGRESVRMLSSTLNAATWRWPSPASSAPSPSPAGTSTGSTCGPSILTPSTTRRREQRGAYESPSDVVQPNLIPSNLPVVDSWVSWTMVSMLDTSRLPIDICPTGQSLYIVLCKRCTSYCRPKKCRPFCPHEGSENY